jgi:hypothetical protein
MYCYYLLLIFMSSRKRLTSNSPRKIQAEKTNFTGKKPDNRSSPLKSYAAAASINRYEALSDDDEEDNTQEIDHCDSSDDTQVTANAQQTPFTTEQEYQPAQSRRNQRMKAKESRRALQPTSPVTTFMSSATKATLEQARKAKELLQNSFGDISDLLLETCEHTGVYHMY